MYNEYSVRSNNDLSVRNTGSILMAPIWLASSVKTVQIACTTSADFYKFKFPCCLLDFNSGTTKTKRKKMFRMIIA